MRHRPFMLVLTSLLIGCTAIPETDPTWQREELEVAVKVDPAISTLLRAETDVAALGVVVSEAVFELADVGLRFYPVPSESYAEDQVHPPFLLTVHVQDVGASLEGETVRTAGEERRPLKELTSVSCSAVATLVKRRGDGPPLIVGKSIGHGSAKAQEASATLTSMQEFELTSIDPFAIPPRLSAESLRKSIREAVRGALRQLVEPIDRELGTRGPVGSH